MKRCYIPAVQQLNPITPVGTRVTYKTDKTTDSQIRYIRALALETGTHSLGYTLSSAFHYLFISHFIVFTI